MDEAPQARAAARSPILEEPTNDSSKRQSATAASGDGCFECIGRRFSNCRRTGSKAPSKVCVGSQPRAPKRPASRRCARPPHRAARAGPGQLAQMAGQEDIVVVEEDQHRAARGSRGRRWRRPGGAAASCRQRSCAAEAGRSGRPAHDEPVSALTTTTSTSAQSCIAIESSAARKRRAVHAAHHHAELG